MRSRLSSYKRRGEHSGPGPGPGRGVELQSPRGREGCPVLVAVVRTDLLNQPVVGAVERHVDADGSEGLGAHPADVALRLLLIARLGRVVVAQHHLLAALGPLAVQPAAERLGVFGGDHALTPQVELHLSQRRDEADGHVAHTCGVVAEVDPQGAVPVVHHLADDQQVQFDRFDVRVEVPPDERPGEFGFSMSFGDRTKL